MIKLSERFYENVVTQSREITTAPEWSRVRKNKFPDEVIRTWVWVCHTKWLFQTTVLWSFWYIYCWIEKKFWPRSRLIYCWNSIVIAKCYKCQVWLGTRVYYKGVCQRLWPALVTSPAFHAFWLIKSSPKELVNVTSINTITQSLSGAWDLTKLMLN